jgi:hypothetical protein
MREGTVATIGGRVFSVTIEGFPVLTRVDLYALAGKVPVAWPFQAVCSEVGRIALVFKTVYRSAMVSSIEWRPLIGGGGPVTGRREALTLAAATDGSYSLDPLPLAAPAARAAW